MNSRERALFDSLLALEGGEARANLRSALSALLTYLGARRGAALWSREGEPDLWVGVPAGLADALTLAMGEAWAHCRATLSLPSLVRVNEPVWRAEIAQCAVHLGAKALFLLPLGEPSMPGGFALLALSPRRTLSTGEVKTMAQAGQIIGQALDRATQSARLRRLQRLMQALYEVSAGVLNGHTLESLLNLVVHSAVTTIDHAENCVLHLLDEASGELHPRALSFQGERAGEEGQARMRLGEGVAGYALAEGKVLNIPDVSRDARFLPFGERRRFTSILVAPLIRHERRIGTLSVDSLQANAFDLDDERLLLIFASHAATAIENARLLADLQESLERLCAMQDQLIQAEKLSALGRMLRGVTHELNNPLAAVMGYTQLLQMDEALPEEVQRDLERIYAQAERAARVVRGLQIFARQEPVVRQLVDVNEIVRSVLELQETQLRLDHIQVVENLASQPLGVMGDFNHLQQVFFHLIANAREAMVAHRGEGRLEVSSRRQGDRVKVCIGDNGPGLSEEVKRNLFDPFFTTKEVGEGMGLGLSICYGIIAGHGGRIYAESEPGVGTTFTVELPAAY